MILNALLNWVKELYPVTWKRFSVLIVNEGVLPRQSNLAYGLIGSSLAWEMKNKSLILFLIPSLQLTPTPPPLLPGFLPLDFSSSISTTWNSLYSLKTFPRNPFLLLPHTLKLGRISLTFESPWIHKLCLLFCFVAFYTCCRCAFWEINHSLVLPAVSWTEPSTVPAAYQCRVKLFLWSWEVLWAVWQGLG